jgi:hypothetical protein
MELILPLEVQKSQHPSASSEKSRKKWQCRKPMWHKDLLVDLIEIEPTTSSMPFLNDHVTY